jgi:hypothetical protein
MISGINLTKIKTLYALGFNSLRRVLTYRLSVKFDFNPVKKLQAEIQQGDFFTMPSEPYNTELTFNNQWHHQQCYFGLQIKKTSEIPNWHKSMLSDIEVEKSQRNWWEIPDFDSKLGDIKGVWEASRFDWLFCFAQQAAQGEQQALNKLNSWLNDWSVNNPPYKGVNWKCGQEASIRVIHIAMAAIILKQDNSPSAPLLSFIKAHLKRILPTISYAVGQDNNHGTSEAAALFIGGSWLIAAGDTSGEEFYKKGCYWLEDRAKHLIEDDGSFSQYSTTYHRVMLDTFSMVEIWRNKHSLSKFSDTFYKKLAAATNWLYQVTQFKTGDAPNLGANDGARLLPLTGTDYRDFRPSVQLAAVLFLHNTAWQVDGSWNLPLKWLRVMVPKSNLLKQSTFHFPHGGYSGLRTANNAFVFINYPNFKFRPSQCDALHLDFWKDGANLLRDGGTFSYNAGDHYINYYGGSESHNTVQFDNKEQMPRLSRFLLGDWLKANNIACDLKKNTCQGAYTNDQGATHNRAISLSEHLLRVEDRISGFNTCAILRWRLSPGNWEVNGNIVSDGKHILTIRSDMAIARLELIVGKESRYYYQESDIPVLEVEVKHAGKIITEYQY